MSVWDWIDDFEARARSAGDTARLRLTRILPEAYEYRHTDPDQMLALFEEGRRLAIGLREPWWVLFFDYWHVEALIYYKEDYRTLLDAAVKLAVEAHRPAHAGNPLLLPVRANLIAAYLCVDPHGYADEIRAALDDALKEPPAQDGAHYLFLFRREWFAWEMGNIDEALEATRRVVDLAEADRDRHRANHHLIGAHICLCRLTHRRRDWFGLNTAATVGEELARQRGVKYELALFLLWQAVWTRHLGRRDESRRLCRAGMAQMGRLGKPPDEVYFDALCAWHELAGEWESALEARTRQATILAGRGQWASECLCALQRCRLLAMMGRSLEEAADAVRTAAARLRRPGFYLERLARLLHGDTELD